MIKSDKIIGIMGGTFNPIHKGHTGIARCAYEQSDIDEILFMPSGTPAYKDNSPIVSATDRCNMVKLAIKPFDYMSLSTIETDRPGNQKHFLADKYGAVIDFIDVPKLPYSSTDIRKKVAMGLSVKEDVGEEVEEYIKSRKLYV